LDRLHHREARHLGRRELAAERGAWSGNHWTFTNAQETVHSAPGLALTETSWQTNVLSVPEFTESPREILSAVKISKVASSRKCPSLG